MSQDEVQAHNNIKFTMSGLNQRLLRMQKNGKISLKARRKSIDLH